MYESTPEALDRVWVRFSREILHDDSRYFERYSYVSRKSLRGQRFEDWLFAQGGRVAQRDHERFLRFYSEDDALMFLLRWG